MSKVQPISTSDPEDDIVFKAAVFDAGSGTTTGVVYGISAKGELRKLFSSKSVCKLGDGVAADGRITSKSTECVIEHLKAFQAAAAEHGVNEVHAFATAAAREAKNRKSFLSKVKSETGIKPRVLSGKKEAKLALIGASHGLNLGDDSRMGGDLGRTSLDVGSIKNGKTSHLKSLLLGCSEVSARSKKQDAYIEEELDGLHSKSPKGKKMHVVGGAWRAAAKAYLRSKGLDHKKDLHGYEVSVADFNEFLDVLENSDEETLVKEFGIPEERVADLPGSIKTLRKMAQKLETTDFLFSQFGVREGYVLHEVWRKHQAAEEKPAISRSAPSAEPAALEAVA